MNRPPSTAEIPSKGAAAVESSELRVESGKTAEQVQWEREEYHRIRRQTGAMGGRPAQLTLALGKKIAKDIGFGMTHRTACARHGVNYETWQSAIKSKPTFSLALDQQNADWLFNALKIIQLGMPGDGGARWLAERRFNEFRKVDTDVQVHQVTHVHQTPEFQQEVAAYARRLDHGLKGGTK